MDLAAQLAHAQSNRDAGNIAEAISTLRQVLAAHPQHPEASSELADLLIGDGQPADAWEVLQPLVDADSPDPWLLALGSRASLLLQEPTRALDLIRRAADLDPNNASFGRELAVLALRRAFTYAPARHQELFERASAGTLSANDVPELARQCFAKMLRPPLLDLLANGAPVGQDRPLLALWAETLEPEAQNDLAVLNQNFQNVLAAMQRTQSYAAAAATVQFRDGARLSTRDLRDVSPFLCAGLELVQSDGVVRTFGFGELETVVFGPLDESIRASATLRSGGTISGVILPLYPLTEFSSDEGLRDGRKLVLRALSGEVLLPLGARVWQHEGGLLPFANIERVSFGAAPFLPGGITETGV